MCFSTSPALLICTISPKMKLAPRYPLLFGIVVPKVWTLLLQGWSILEHRLTYTIRRYRYENNDSWTFWETRIRDSRYTIHVQQKQVDEKPDLERYYGKVDQARKVIRQGSQEWKLEADTGKAENRFKNIRASPSSRSSCCSGRRRRRRRRCRPSAPSGARPNDS